VAVSRALACYHLRLSRHFPSDQRIKTIAMFWRTKKSEEPSLATILPYFDSVTTKLIGGYLGEDSKLKAFNKPHREQMADAFPTVRLLTLERFLVARDNDVKAAREMFSTHQGFRNKCHEKKFAERSAKIIGKGDRALIIRKGTALDGSEILGFRLSLVTKKQLEDVEALADAIGWFIFDTMEKMGPYWKPRFTVLAPTNAIDNAPNLSARTLLPVLKSTSKILGANFPEIARKIIVFPFPWIGRVLWKICSFVVDPKTRKKVLFLGGSESRHSLPDKHVFTYISEDSYDHKWLQPLPKIKIDTEYLAMSPTVANTPVSAETPSSPEPKQLGTVKE